ncbi:hypothetical protein FS749_005630 [Ceratobasidium sp. UAMH 11750]|nr:hypothetical protein FS749_005630 [Ceratobasidium sp. UAMH 11750]
MNKCCAEDKQGDLQQYGITGPLSPLTEEDMREYIPLWVAKDRQPYRIIGDRYLCKLIAPQGRGYIPHCETIAQDIKIMSNATQAKIMAQLAVWGIVCNNTSNNATMMEHITEYGLKRLTRPNDRVFCMLHVINLAAQLKPHNDDNNEEQYDIVDFDQLEVDPADIDENDVEHAPSWALCGDDDEDPFVNIELPAIEPGTPEALESARVGTILIKIVKFARRLRYLSKVKKIFKEVCVEKEVETPHNMRRDQKMHWNSTSDMSGDMKRTFPAIVATQQDPRLAIPHSQRLVMEDLKYINGLITLLEPLKSLTKILLCGGVPMLADVLVHFDALDYIYTNIAADENQPAWMQHSAKCALTVFNKNHGKTDSSNLYHLAVLFHPSMCVHYLKQADWLQ